MPLVLTTEGSKLPRTAQRRVLILSFESQIRSRTDILGKGA